ncbi:MAG: glycosyltransferase family 2 protein, partial [Candidatus Acidiferrales bacterium]
IAGQDSSVTEPINEPNRRPKLSVVIPVYNEAKTIQEILRRVAAVKIDKEIVVVDDCSADGTREVLRQLETSGDAGLAGSNLRVFYQDRNQGKGAALRRGFAEAHGEIVLIQDADLEYNPEDYGAILDPFERGLAAVVYGSRFSGGAHRVLFFWHSVGNRFLTLLSNMFTDLNLTDVWTCYKAFRREVLEQIVIRENRFGIEPEITAKVARGKWPIFEVPISYDGRTYAQGKKITWKDGIRALVCVVRYNVFDSRP